MNKNILIALLGMIGGLGYLVGISADHLVLQQATRVIPHLAFIYFLTRVWSVKSDGYRLWTLVGLISCMIGDFILRLPGGFLIGLIIFLIGHLFFIVAFSQGGVKVHFVRAIPFVLYGLGFFFYLKPGLGAMTIPVAAYACVICTMGWRAAARIGFTDNEPERQKRQVFALIGACIFVLSDSMIGVNRYAFEVAGIRYVIVLTYWIALYFITSSAQTVSVGNEKGSLSQASV